MNLCIPVDENLGLKSTICLHFGTAPYLLVVNPKTFKFEVFENPDHTGTDPLLLRQLLFRERVTDVVVGGIGVTALDCLTAGGIRVFSCTEDTIFEIVQAFNAKTVNPVTLGTSCGKTASSGRGFSLPSCGRKFGGGCSGGC